MSDTDADVLSHEFCIETHMADAMPESHWHDHIEVNYLWSGTLRYLINGQLLTLHAGDLCVFWAASPHQVISVDDEQRLSCAYVPLSMFLALNMAPEFRRTLLHGGVFFGHDDDEADRHTFARWTREWSEADAQRRQLLEEEVGLRLKRLSWSATFAEGNQRAAGAVGQRAVRHTEGMTKFIHERLDGRLTVADVVEASGLHPTNAHAAFARVLGMTIGEYIRRQRLRHAMRLLVDTDVEIAQIAYDCGYSSVGRLYDAFQQRLKKTPRAYRMEFRGYARG
ncbi:MAG: helix-turn-helix domain-containing protein [Devosia sp.]